MSNDGKTSFEVFCSHCGQRLSLTINLGVAVNASITVPAFQGLTLAPKEQEEEEGVFVNLNEQSERRLQAKRQLPTQSIPAATPDLNKNWDQLTTVERHLAVQKAHAEQEPVVQFCRRFNIGVKKLAAYRNQHDLLYKIKYVPKHIRPTTTEAPLANPPSEKKWKTMTDEERTTAINAAKVGHRTNSWICKKYEVPRSTLMKFKLVFGLSKHTRRIPSERVTYSKWQSLTLDQQIAAMYAAYNANTSVKELSKHFGIDPWVINQFKLVNKCRTKDMVANKGICPVRTPEEILERDIEFLAETIRTTKNQIRTWLLVEPLAVKSLFSRPRDFKTCWTDWASLKTQAEHSSGKLLKLMSEHVMRTTGYTPLNDLLPSLDGSYNAHKKAIMADKTPAILRGSGFWIAEKDIPAIRRTDKDIPLRKRVHGVLEVEAQGYLVLTKLVKELKMTEHQIITAVKEFETESGKKALVTIKEPTGPGTKTIRVIDPKVWDPRTALATTK